MLDDGPVYLVCVNNTSDVRSMGMVVGTTSGHGMPLMRVRMRMCMATPVSKQRPCGKQSDDGCGEG